MRVLITGFEPTWGIKKTPSGELAKLWANGDLTVPGIEVHSVVLPQIFGKSAEMTIAEIQTFDPQAVLMFGATMKNDPLRLERFAINCEASDMGDNTRIPVVPDRSIIQGGPAAYESTLPVYWLMDHLNALGLDTKVSYNAGTHTCNSLMYHVLHFLSTKPHPMPVIAGFVHVPFPNEFGVVEDSLWTTASFEGIVQASVGLVQKVRDWYQEKFGPVEQTPAGISAPSGMSTKKGTK
jgi:pyroglutamyl-peptidase